MKTDEEIQKLAEEAYPITELYINHIQKSIDGNATARIFWMEGYKAAQANEQKAYDDGFQAGCTIASNDILSRI